MGRQSEAEELVRLLHPSRDGFSFPFLFLNELTRGYEKLPLNYIPFRVVLPTKFELQKAAKIR
jgi:hypothetical protein